LTQHHHGWIYRKYPQHLEDRGAAPTHPIHARSAHHLPPGRLCNTSWSRCKRLAEINANADPNNLLGLLDLFVGGAFSAAGIFALGIMPYITASIVIQLMGAVVPYFQKLQREGEEGRRKITQLTRYGTIMVTALQSIGFAINLQYGATGQAIVIGIRSS
jgi:hypothetical protein